MIAEYIDRGLSVLPLRHDTKKPLGRWRRWMRERMTLEQAKSWWGTFEPKPNVGIVTGSISNDLNVLDVEPEHVDYVKRNLELPRTATVQTARGGLHIYCHGELPCGKLKHQGRILGDVRGSGGYVVAPPSSTPMGVYAWIQSMRWTPVPAWAEVLKKPTAVVTPLCPARFEDCTELVCWFPCHLLVALEGWIDGGQFSSASELDFRIMLECIYLGAAFEECCEVFEQFPFGENARKHDATYLERTYLNAHAIVEQDRQHVCEVRCLRIVEADGTISGGAKKRALLEFAVDNQVLRYCVPVVLRNGVLSGEWRQLAAAYGADPTPDPSFINGEPVCALVKDNRIIRFQNWTQ